MIEPQVDLPFNDRIASYPKWRIAIQEVSDLLRSTLRDPRNVSSWQILLQKSAIITAKRLTAIF
jgi:hypothetical protein